MANDKYYGYSPKKETRKPSTGVTDVGTRLDRVNPYEFRKGMDVELTSLGVSRLAESTPEEREKATETVLKNLEEYSGYYSAFVHYMTEYRNMDDKPTFKNWLKEYREEHGMKEVDKSFKNDKMEKLKEAIKTEVKSILTEAKNDDDKDEKKASKGAKKSSKGMKALDKEENKLRDQKKKLQDKIFPLIQDFKNKKIDKDKYEKKVGDIPQQIKDINKRLGEIDKEKEAIILKEKEDRRAVAETAMDREVHMELLNIIKEAGVSLREGSEGVKTYYEIAKIAYMEGLTAGLRGE